MYLRFTYIYIYLFLFVFFLRKVMAPLLSMISPEKNIYVTVAMVFIYTNDEEVRILNRPTIK